jgi:hypothetical protein
MAGEPERVVAIVARVATPGHPAFQLRKGEEGLSVFDPHAVDPPLAEAEILEPFRPGSVVLYRTVAQITEVGLTLAVTEGAEVLPERLRAAHREIVPGPGMARPAFKAALKLLE